MINGQRRVISTTELGRWNAEIVLEQLYSRKPHTNAELGRETDLSRSTVERALDLLVGQGLVTKSEPVALLSGRPAAVYQLRPEFGYLLAVDIGAHTVRVRVDDLTGPEPGQGPAAGTGTGSEPEPVPVSPGDETGSRLRAAEHLASHALASAGVAPGQVRAVTIATPGIVDPAGTIVLCRVIRAPDWAGDLLRSWARERFPRAVVTVDNDANLGILAEQRFGAIGGAGEAVAAFAGSRIGFGILHGGTVHRGAHNQAGEAANVRGSSWAQASKWLHGHAAEIAGLLASAAAGQSSATAAVGEFAALLARAFAEVVHTVDPELIVLGGAVSLAGPAILDPLTEQFRQAFRGTVAPPLLLSALGRRAVLLGAAERARRQAFSHLLDEAWPQLTGPGAGSRR